MLDLSTNTTPVGDSGGAGTPTADSTPGLPQANSKMTASQALTSVGKAPMSRDSPCTLLKAVNSNCSITIPPPRSSDSLEVA